MALWGAWAAAIIVSFAVFEGLALKTNRFPTLSRTVWNISRAWPPFGWVVGLVIGFVCAHFWWGGSLICYN